MTPVPHPLRFAIYTIAIAIPLSVATAQDAAKLPGAVESAPSQRCMRLPLTDIAFGEQATIAQARKRLDEYAVKEGIKRGYGKGPFVKSAETASCTEYLYLPFLGQEYKCLVTTTYCTK